MLTTVVIASILACVSGTFYKGNMGGYGQGGNNFRGYGPLNSMGYYRGMGGFADQLGVFNGGYPKGGMNRGYKKGGMLDGGYSQGGMKGYKKGGMFDGEFMGGYPKGGMFDGGLMGGYPKGGVFGGGLMGGYKKGEMFGGGVMGGFANGGMFGGSSKGAIGGYPKGGKNMMDGMFSQGFDGLNSYASGFGMDVQGLGGYPKFGNGGFGQIGGAYGIKGFNRQSGFKKGGY